MYTSIHLYTLQWSNCALEIFLPPSQYNHVGKRSSDVKAPILYMYAWLIQR